MRWLMCLTVGLAFAVSTAQAADQQRALAGFQQAFPGVKFYVQESGIGRVYGTAFGFGDAPEITAEQFRLSHAEIFGVDPDDLLPIGPAYDGRYLQPVMYDQETGEYKFTLACYSQYHDGIPVFRSHVKLLVRNERDYPLVLAASSLRDLGDFTVGRAIKKINAKRFQKAVTALVPGLVNFTKPQPVIWAGVDDMVVEPKLAVEFVGDNGKPATGEYEKWLFIADAATAEILYKEDLILNVDVYGNVSGYATEGSGADICGPEVLTPMPYTYVSIDGGNWAYADENGDFVISHPGSAQVTVRSPVRGQWFRVYNQAGPDTELELDVIPPGPANFEHNAGGGQYTTAEVNAYVHANVIRDLVLFHNPDYPVIATQTNFRVNVNINDYCNAYYDGSSINFYRAGGGCANTAFSVVVHHEYGHHLVAVAGSGQGAYGEGMGDCMGVLITEDSVTGRGFQNDCSRGIRDANNNMQYPCSGPIHYCGQLLSGCVWSTRGELMVTEPEDYLAILSNLTINSILLHVGSSITPQITIDFLTLDDDDGNLNNGTPHYVEIDAGFGAHNMPAPPLSLLEFTYPSGRPDLINPNGGTRMRVEVEPLVEDPQPGTGMLHYSTGGGFTGIPMEQISDNVYDAVFPAITCGETVTYYVSAETTGGATATDPPNAPTSVYTTYSAFGLEVVMEDDFETNQGWTVENQNLSTGAWERAVPSGSGGARGDPPSDFDGSGRCYVTGNGYDEDVDGGPTRLTSPMLDLTGGGEYLVSYARWIYNDDGDDTLDVEISNGGGWVLVESVTGQGGWVERSFSIGDFVTPNATVEVRFTTADQPNDSITEAGLDAFKVTGIECEEGDVILPDDYTIVRGQHVSGGLTDLFYSDDSYLLLWPNLFLTPTEPPVWVIVEGTATTASPAGLSFTLEAYATTTGLVQKIELYNYVTQSYEELDSRNTTLSDSVIEVVVGGDPSRFIEPGTLAMQAQMTWRFGPVGIYAFDVGIDQTVWTITP